MRKRLSLLNRGGDALPVIPDKTEAPSDQGREIFGRRFLVLEKFLRLCVSVPAVLLGFVEYFEISIDSNQSAECSACWVSQISPKPLVTDFALSNLTDLSVRFSSFFALRPRAS